MGRLIALTEGIHAYNKLQEENTRQMLKELQKSNARLDSHDRLNHDAHMNITNRIGNLEKLFLAIILPLVAIITGLKVVGLI